MKYVIVIEKAEGNLNAYFPDVEGCVTTGATVEEVLENATEALELHLEDEDKAPVARSLRAILDEGLEVSDGSEIFATVEYEQKALATA